MNPNRFFATFVSGLLVIDESRFDEAYALVAQLSALDQVEVQRGTGAGSEDKLALRQWILEQRAKEVLSVSIGVEDGSVATGHDHAGWDRLRQMLAGFADGLPILMRVDTAGEGAVLVQGTVPGPRLSLTSSQFLELLDGQDQRGFFQPGVLDEINAYRTESQRDDIAPAALASDLVSPEGQRDWEVVGRQVFRTVQADALTHEWHFLIPTSFMHHIEKRCRTTTKNSNSPPGWKRMTRMMSPGPLCFD